MNRLSPGDEAPALSAPRDEIDSALRSEDAASVSELLAVDVVWCSPLTRAVLTRPRAKFRTFHA